MDAGRSGAPLIGVSHGVAGSASYRRCMDAHPAVTLVQAVEDLPTVEQIDYLLTMLSTAATDRIPDAIDTLLEMRSVLTQLTT